MRFGNQVQLVVESRPACYVSPDFQSILFATSWTLLYCHQNIGLNITKSVVGQIGSGGQIIRFRSPSESKTS